MERLPAETIVHVLSFLDRNSLLVLGYVSRSFCSAVPRNLTEETCEYFAKEGLVNLLKWARENGCKWNSLVCVKAARAGHLEALKWAHENGCKWNSLVCVKAAAGGHLNVLRYLEEIGHRFSSFVCEVAVSNGHLEAAEWLIERGFLFGDGAVNKAAHGGHLHVIKWVVANGRVLGPLVFSAAASGGHLELLKWMRKNGHGCELRRLKFISFEVVKWMYEEGIVTDILACEELLSWDCSLPVLEWMVTNGHEFSWRAYDYISASGNLKALKWAREKGEAPRGDKVWENFAKAGNLKAMKWLVSNGFDCQKNLATKLCSADVLEWLFQRGQMPREPLMDAAVDSGSTKVLEWAFSKNSEWERGSERHYVKAARSNQAGVIEWLHNKGCPCDTEACREAADNGSLECLKYMRRNGFPWDARYVTLAATRSECPRTIMWLHGEGCLFGEQICLKMAKSDKLDFVKWFVRNVAPVRRAKLLSAATWIDGSSVAKWLDSLPPNYPDVPDVGATSSYESSDCNESEFTESDEYCSSEESF